MPQFKEMGFTFNGEESRDKGFFIVNVTNSDQHENEIGLKKSIQEVDNNNITKTFTSLLSESDMPAPLHILPEYLHLTALLLSVQYLLHAHSV